MNTGEDIQALRKIADLSRMVSIAILAIHAYLTCYLAFRQWGWTADISDRLLANLLTMGFLDGMAKPKFGALIFLAISLMGVRGRKDEKINWRSITAYIVSGLSLYFASALTLYLTVETDMLALCYIGTTAIGYLLMVIGGTHLSRLVKFSLQRDIFNNDNETFPQEERLLQNEYSINLPAKYNLKGKLRDSWINFINPFRGLLVIGTPGAGKSYFIIRHIIDQHIKKGFAMFVYDFKYPDLTHLAYNKLLQYRKNYGITPKFYIINFDNLNQTHRCNPLDPHSMTDITDATEASRSIMLGLNRQWLQKIGDFFVESPISFLTAIIWFLRKYRDGIYCTLPHALELMQVDYDPLFAVLSREEEIKALISPFLMAFQNNAKEQLEGQIASAKIGLGRLSSPQLYWVLSGSDFTLDVNNPEDPKILALGNNPQKLQIYGAVLSLFVSRMIKLVNQKGKQKCSLIFDEFPTIYVGGSSGVDGLLATARSNLVATTLAVQNQEQITRDYGRETADVIFSVVGNIISGQATGETAKALSETLGKIMQERTSSTLSSNDTTFTKSMQLDYAVPASKIATLSSGTFVGMVADNPNEKMALKIFHSEIQNDHEAIASEESRYRPIPSFANVTEDDVRENYLRIKREVHDLMVDELRKIEAEMSPSENDEQPAPTHHQKAKKQKKRRTATSRNSGQRPPIPRQEQKNTTEQSAVNRPTSM
ncbi:conjugal transfer protein MobC [Parapedobacter koreensis]|uniref:Type IV secretory system Conjugative DNA transfer n=1 Tax=Parapedobacter koreensis TaxID=332977 RepID=A0A1H7FG45_9SPHI|nr:conjugal transfer protein MobC [Parapedobacter koreensis]SEK25056.1 Type IV secretory system Conjugative DNA transfer [Parapedobacter koreensis]